jgi:tripartite-type tricarboxylate transporter receptor subunit TctC
MPISSTFVVLPQRDVKMPLDLHRDIVPIGLVGEQPMLIAVNPKLGVKTLAELVALAKKQPGKIMYGAGAGGLPHMTGAAFQQRAGIDLKFVPYTKQTQATQDTVGGTLQLVVESMSGLAGAIQSGRLVPLAVASAKRLPNAPDIPTVAEALPNIGTFETRGWFALTAPASTPPAIIDKVSEDLRSVLAQPGLQESLAKLGTYARPMTPAELAVFIRSEQELWWPIVRRILASTP